MRSGKNKGETGCNILEWIWEDVYKRQVDKIPSAEYTGKEITPVPVVTVKTKVGNKTQYVPLDPACYEVEYSNNIEKGTATVFILGKGEYGGVKKVTFKITGQKMSWWEKIF